MAYPTNNYPTSIQNPTKPVATDDTAVFDHAGLESFQNDSIVALKTKVGANSSTDNTSFDYKLSEVATGDKAVSKTATQTLTNKTLTSPTLNTPNINVGSDANGDLYYRNGSTFTRLPIGTSGYYLTSSGTAPQWSSAASLATQGGVQNGSYVYAATSTGNDSYAITLSPAVGAYVAGQTFYFKADVANTGAATLNVNGLGAKTIKKNVSQDLADNDIIAGQIVEVIYDGTNFQINTSTPTTYSTGTTAGTSGWAAGGTDTITHNLGVIPRLIRLITTTTTIGGSGGTSISHGTAVITPAGSITSQQSNTINATVGALGAAGIANYILRHAGNGGGAGNGTLATVTSTTFTITIPNIGQTGTSNYLWEVYA